MERHKLTTFNRRMICGLLVQNDRFILDLYITLDLNGLSLIGHEHIKVPFAPMISPLKSSRLLRLKEATGVNSLLLLINLPKTTPITRYFSSILQSVVYTTLAEHNGLPSMACKLASRQHVRSLPYT